MNIILTMAVAVRTSRVVHDLRSTTWSCRLRIQHRRVVRTCIAVCFGVSSLSALAADPLSKQSKTVPKTDLPSRNVQPESDIRPLTRTRSNAQRNSLILDNKHSETEQTPNASHTPRSENPFSDRFANLLRTCEQEYNRGRIDVYSLFRTQQLIGEVSSGDDRFHQRDWDTVILQSRVRIAERVRQFGQPASARWPTELALVTMLSETSDPLTRSSLGLRSTQAALRQQARQFQQGQVSVPHLLSGHRMIFDQLIADPQSNPSDSQRVEQVISAYTEALNALQKQVSDASNANSPIVLQCRLERARAQLTGQKFRGRPTEAGSTELQRLGRELFRSSEDALRNGSGSMVAVLDAWQTQFLCLGEFSAEDHVTHADDRSQLASELIGLRQRASNDRTIHRPGSLETETLNLLGGMADRQLLFVGTQRQKIEDQKVD